MAKYQLIGCKVALAGDIRHTVLRDADNPITLPEKHLLDYIHGAGAVTEVVLLGEIERAPADEFNRLLAIYGPGPVKDLYPTPSTRMPERDPDILPPEQVKTKGKRKVPTVTEPNKVLHAAVAADNTITVTTSPEPADDAGSADTTGGADGGGDAGTL